MRKSSIVHLAISSVLTICMLASCKKDKLDERSTSPPPPRTANNNPPDQFTISVLASSWDTATISWTKAIDPDKDSVFYKVYLNDTLKADNYRGLSYTFRNLKEITAYRVKVVAVDAKQNETPSTANFDTKKYWLKFLQKVEYGPITGYSSQKTGQMIRANDGGYIIVGDSQLGSWPYGTIQTLTIKIDSLGNKIWEKRYNYMSGNSMEIKIINYSGGYIICGGDNLMRINNNGDLIWRKMASLPSEVINGIAATADGSIYTVGQASGGSQTSIQVATLCKYDQNGNLLFQKTFPRTPRDEFFDVKMFPDNTMVVLGRTGDPNADFWVLKMTTDGSIIWEKIYQDAGHAFPENIIKTAEGNYVFTGFSLGAAVIPYMYLQMIDGNGNSMWTYIAGNNTTKGYSVAETSDNSLIVTGGYQLTYSSQSALYKFDKNGNKLFEKLYGEFATYLINKTVIPTSDGGYMINCQKSKAYNSSGEVDQIYIFKTDDKGEFN